MFFPRLRRHAKWLFVFLALAFGLGFVGFGVGAGGVGVGDLFRSNGGGETASVSDAREKTEENPKDVEAWRELSTALQTEGETEEALGALQIAVSLDKKDADLYRELAGLYLAQASAKSQEVQRAQIAAAYGAPGQNFPGQLSFKGKQVFDDPIGQAINAAGRARRSPRRKRPPSPRRPVPSRPTRASSSCGPTIRTSSPSSLWRRSRRAIWRRRSLRTSDFSCSRPTTRTRRSSSSS